MIWFQGIKTRIELKDKFRELALIHHPDHGGDSRIMREILAEYERLRKTLPEGKREAPAARRKAEKPHYPARARKPLYAHEQICLFARALFIYGRLAEICTIRGLYRLLCQRLDPCQTRSYRDYGFNVKVAQKSLRGLEKTLARVFDVDFQRLLKTCKANLEAHRNTA